MTFLDSLRHLIRRPEPPRGSLVARIKSGPKRGHRIYMHVQEATTGPGGHDALPFTATCNRCDFTATTYYPLANPAPPTELDIQRIAERTVDAHEYHQETP